MATTILRDDFATGYFGPYEVVNNVWGKRDLVNGTDFTQTITYDPASAPAGVTFAWDWPDVAGDRVLSYPALKAGYNPWNEAGAQNLTSQVRDLKSFTLTYDVDLSGATGDFNLAIDLWLADSPGGTAENITAEVFIGLHDPNRSLPDDAPTYTDEVNGYQGRILEYDGLSNGTYVWDFIGLESQEDLLDGTIDLAPLLKDLVRKGLISGTDYITGFEFGNEVFDGGPGSMRINSFSHAFSRYAVTEGADSLAGTTRSDDFGGRGGNDSLKGLGGNDRLDGGNGNDAILGGNGNDTLSGGAGNDRLTGGRGADSMAGGNGNDDFVFAVTDAATDRIDDFTRGADRIVLTAFAGTLTFVGGAAFSGEGDGEVRATRQGASTLVTVDADGDGDADLSVSVSGTAALTAGDFLL
jgi:Ca2+-binding RTX toxin-like protein